jgi:hypothetical protein
MDRLRITAITFHFALVLAGCGKSEPAASPPQVAIGANPVPDAPAATSQPPDVVIPPNLDPKQTIVEYLHAVKEGDEAVVAALLTDVARRKTAEANMKVAPPVSESVSFSVGNMELVSEDKKTAHVASTWTNTDDGTEQTLRIVWVVHQEPEGWRVKGMVTRLSPDLPMFELNFENPVETVRRANEEMARFEEANSKRGAEAGKQPPGISGSQAPGAEEGLQRQARGPLDTDPTAPR